jgi:hypothetical protein
MSVRKTPLARILLLLLDAKVDAWRRSAILQAGSKQELFSLKSLRIETAENPGRQLKF